MEKIEEIIENFEFLEDWEQKYLYIIDLGRKLPDFPEKFKKPENIVEGCQSRVWVVLDISSTKDSIKFIADSDSQIVKGLVALVLACYNEKNAKDISNFEIESVFKELDLESNLSGNRSNGLKSMVQKIRSISQLL